MPPYRETEVEEWVKKYDDEMTAKDSEFHSETELYTQGASTLRITNPHADLHPPMSSRRQITVPSWD